MNLEYLLIAFIILFAVSSIFNLSRPSNRLARLERKIDLLIKHAGIDPYADVPSDVIAAIKADNLLEAIRLYRKATGVSLKEAKELVEGISKA